MKTKHWLLFGTAAMILAVAFILTGCPDTSGDKEPEKIAAPAPSPASQDVFAIDISQETDWNYMVVGKDGSSLFFNADESTGIPTLAYLKPEKDSDAGLNLLF
jgi:hypothetical protein